MNNKKVFLDTHALVFLYNKDLQAFKKKGLYLLNEYDLLISPIVRLELQYLYEKKNIISAKPDVVIQFLQETMDLEIDSIPYSDIITQSLKLNWTRDVFDRTIVAHAICHDCSLISRDRIIKKHYPKTVW